MPGYEVYGRPIVWGVFSHAGADQGDTVRQIAALVATLQRQAPRVVPYVQTDPETTYVYAVRVIERVDGSPYV
jgi:hypothetical protein